MRDCLNARDALNLVLISQRQRLNDGDAIDRDQAIRALDIGAARERASDYREKCEEKQCNRKRADGQNQAQFLAEKIGKNQPAEFHAAPPVAGSSCDS